MDKLYVYISGPLHSSGRAQINVRNACLAAEELRKSNPNIVPIVPHLMMYWDAMSPHNKEYWLAIDKDLLMRCDALLRIEGHSIHGDLEVEWAKEEGLEVFYTIGALVMRFEKGVLRPRRPTTDFSLDDLQEELKPWVEKNFPHTYPEGVLPYRPFLGMMEELGEMAHAHLKLEQGIRGTAEEHEEAGKDALADLFIYMADYATQRGWSIREVVEHTWKKVVSKRDWTANKEDGVVKIDVAVVDAVPAEEIQLTLAVDEAPAEEEEEYVPSYKYDINQQVKSLSGRGGYGTGAVVDRRGREGEEPEYLCMFGAFRGWVPETDIDPIVIGVDLSEQGDEGVLLVNVMVDGKYVKTSMHLAEGQQYVLLSNPYRNEQRVCLSKIESATRLSVVGLENSKRYLVTPHELRPIPDESTGSTGGPGA